MSTTTTTQPITAADTCRRVASIRALYSELESNPYQEPLARMLADDTDPHRTRSMHSQWPPIQNEVNAVVVRSMMIDHLLTQFCRKHPNQARVQILILGAGMDTRAYRLPQQPQPPQDNNNIHWNHVYWYEVDVDEVLQTKQTLLRQNANAKDVTPHSHNLVQLGLDLATHLDDLFPQLQQHHGYDPNAPTMYVLEGLLYYIPIDGVVKLLQALPINNNHSQNNQNELVLTMIDRAMMDWVRSSLQPQSKDDDNDQEEPKSWASKEFQQNLTSIWKCDWTDLIEYQPDDDDVLADWNMVGRHPTNTEGADAYSLGVTTPPTKLKGREYVVHLVQKEE